MAFIHRELKKTLNGYQAYASNRSFLEFVNDSLRDIGISSTETLPSFSDENEERAVCQLLKIRDDLYELKDLAYCVRAHKSFIERAHTGEIELPLEELRYHQDFVENNKPQVAEYISASKTPVEIIDEKISFLNGLHYHLSPSPWRPDKTPRPALYPLIAGVVLHLKYKKNRILSESVTLDSDISGFDDDFFIHLVDNMASTPSWSKPDFREQWARNIPNIRAPSNVDFLNRPSQVSLVVALSENDEDTASTDMVSESLSAPTDPRLRNNNRSVLQVSENKADLFGEGDSDSDIEIVSSPVKNNSLQSI